MNKYQKWYESIVRNAQKCVRSKDNGYLESHHIIPRSLGGDDSVDNVVLLTAKEHFVCHLLLPKFTKGDDRRKMLFALKMMGETREYKSRVYEYYKPLVAKAISESNSGRSIPKTEEWKRKIGEGNRKSNSKPLSKRKYEACVANFKIASEKNRGKKRPPEVVEKCSAKLRGVPKSPEHLAKMRLMYERRQEIVACHQCGKEMKRGGLMSHAKRFCPMISRST